MAYLYIIIPKPRIKNGNNYFGSYPCFNVVRWINSKYQNLPCLNNGENDGFDLEIDDSEDEEEPEETPDLNCMDWIL